MDKKIPPLASKQLEALLVPITDIKPHPENYKTHPPDQIKSLRASLKAFGCTSPIKANLEGLIVAGHGMYQMYIEDGYTHIPVVYEALDKQLSKAYLVADNETARRAITEDSKLAELLKGITDIPDFDIDAVGFTNDDYTQLLSDVTAHDNKFKPGFTPGTDNKPQFILDENTALSADDAALSIFKNRSTILCCYSGGKDSSFALLWAKKNFPDKHIIAIFSDTGVEFPGMVSHIHRVSKYLEVECKIVKPDIDVFEYWERRGRFFNMIFPECQSILIYKPINEFMLTFDPSDVVIIDGSRGDQVRRMTSKSKTSGSCDKCMAEYVYYHPCYDVDYELEKNYVFESGLPIWEGYEMGFKRSACWCCPGQYGEQAYALQQNYPGLANYIRKWEQKLGMPLKGPGGKNFDHLVHSGEVKAQRKSKQITEEEEYIDDDDKWDSFSEELPDDWTPE